VLITAPVFFWAKALIETPKQIVIAAKIIVSFFILISPVFRLFNFDFLIDKIAFIFIKIDFR
jgi:hypothetical protein